MEKLSVMNDFVFKRIFAKKGNEEILKDLLMSILEIKIKTIEVIAEANIERKLEKDKLGILDIKAVIDEKIVIDIEVQIINYYNMIERSLYYWSALYQESLKKGEAFERNKKVITINLVNFEMFEEGSFHEIGRIRRDYEYRILTEQLEMHFIQIPKFMRGSNRTNKRLKQWMQFIIQKEKGEIEMAIKENKEIAKANEELEYLSGDEETRRLAFLREKAIRDETNNLIGAREEGKKEGIIEGINQGMKQGMKQGKQEGAKRKVREITKKMLEKKVEIEMIKEITGLSEEEIEKIKKET